jgi:hypothetical protein
MIKARVIHPFITNGQTVQAGSIIHVKDDALPALGDLVEVIEPHDSLTPVERLMQQNASDFTRFCMAHELTYPDGRCPIKHSRFDPITECLGWQMKTGKASGTVH